MRTTNYHDTVYAAVGALLLAASLLGVALLVVYR